MAEVPVPPPTPEPTPTTAPGTPRPAETPFPTGKWIKQTNEADKLYGQLIGAQAPSPTAASPDLFVKPTNEADALRQGAVSEAAQSVAPPTVLGGPASADVATAATQGTDYTNQPYDLEPWKKFQVVREGPDRWEKPTNNADALSAAPSTPDSLARLLERDQQLLAEISSEQRDALSRGLREIFKQTRGVGDSGDLPGGDQGMLRNIQRWLLGKIK